MSERSYGKSNAMYSNSISLYHDTEGSWKSKYSLMYKEAAVNGGFCH